jgi:hypothetical protein
MAVLVLTHGIAGETPFAVQVRRLSPPISLEFAERRAREVHGKRAGSTRWDRTHGIVKNRKFESRHGNASRARFHVVAQGVIVVHEHTEFGLSIMIIQRAVQRSLCPACDLWIERLSGAAGRRAAVVKSGQWRRHPPPSSGDRPVGADARLVIA